MSDPSCFPPCPRRGARGDLVRLQQALPAEQASAVAGLLGFERKREGEGEGEEGSGSDEVTAAVVTIRKDSSAVAVAPAPPSAGLSTPFWRVEAVEHLGPPAPRPSVKRAAGLTEEDIDNRGRSLFYRPPCPPIAPWSQIEPRIRAALSGERVSQEPDVGAVVRALGRGEVLREVPRRRRRAWPAVLHLWLDRSPRHITVEEDQIAVARQLARLCGPAAVSVRVLDPVTQAYDLAERGHLVPDGHPAGVVLVLGELGACADAAIARGWARTGELLARAGVRPVALVPVGLERLDPRVAACWCAVSWQPRPPPSLSDEQRVVRADRLLRLASPAALIQPGLLRALRLLLPSDEVDMGTEFDALTRPTVRAFDGTGLVLHEESSRRLREAFAVEEPRALQEAVARLIREWHERLPAELLRAETLAWHTRTPDVAPPGDLQDAVEFLGRAESSLSGSNLEDAPSWRRLLRATLAGLPASSYQQGELAPVLSSLWTLAHSDQASAVVPGGVEPPIDDTPLRRWGVRQVGASLQLQPQDADPNPASEPLLPGSPLAAMDLQRKLRARSGGAQRELLVRPGLILPLSPGEEVELQGTSALMTLQPWTPEPWAVAAGRDEYGLWADLEVRGVAQRLRWIPPGRFWMGSPEGEAGRFDDEGPRNEVALTRGFWLGETPVTQRLWEAVMGVNPSRFKSAERPVEQVSWEECVGFCGRVNGEVEGLGVRLPTEAEWEYACRAGTGGATWLGDLEIRGMNDAPLLDGIAWYGGNSGKGFELEDGYDSRDWLEKQHAHEQAGTREVRGRQANPWGLYDMLGNVYEWCEDRYGSYSESPRIDPVVRTGADRVIRGGSWFSVARYARAASRYWYPSERRYGLLGFRLAQGPALSSGTAESRAATGAATARDDPNRASKRPGGRGGR